jgi:hypothetical protein
MVSNGFWHIVSVVKEQVLPVQQKGLRTTANNPMRIPREFQTVNTLFVISTTILIDPISPSAFVGYGEIRLTLSLHATIRLTAAQAVAREKTK